MTTAAKNPAYAWLTAEDVLRHALAAYYAACRQADTWKQAGADDDFHTARALADDVAEIFELKLLAHGQAMRLADFDGDYLDSLQKLTTPIDLATAIDQVDNSTRLRAEWTHTRALAFLASIPQERRKLPEWAVPYFSNSEEFPDIHRAQLSQNKTG